MSCENFPGTITLHTGERLSGHIGEKKIAGVAFIAVRRDEEDSLELLAPAAILRITQLHELPEAAVTPEQIIQAVRDAFQISEEMIRGRVRTRSICEARHACFYFFFHFLAWTQSTIGRFLKRDHGTICNGLKNIESLRTDHVFERKFRSALARLDAVKPREAGCQPAIQPTASRRYA